MENYCKNCGAKIESDADFCHDCGSKIESDIIACKNCGQKINKDAKFCNNCGHPTKEPDNFCQNCGDAVEPGQDFCSQCGTSLNEEPKESFIDKNKNALIIIGAILCVVIVLLGAISFVSNTFPEEIGEQEVEVGSTNFIIPDNYLIDPSTIDVDYKYGSAVFAQGWSNDDGDIIYISTMTVPYNVDANEVIASQGGVQKTLMGYSGYYTEDDDIYNFAFESGGYICIVSVSDPQIFDHITCLG